MTISLYQPMIWITHEPERSYFSVKYFIIYYFLINDIRQICILHVNAFMLD